MRARNGKQGGQILVMVALSMLLLIGTAGLAIDSGLGYIVKAKLNAALDSATLAAARSVTLGVNQTEQRANATLAARRFFAANYPDGYLNSTATLNTPSVTFDNGKVTIDLSARAILPVSIMQILGFSELNVASSSQTIRKDLDLALVIDTSGSLSASRTAVKASAISFLDKFDPNADRVALLHFAYGAVVDDAIRPSARGFDRASTTAHINGYSFSGSTNSSEGMWQARDQLNRIALADRSSLRVIVFFSDGAPNSFASYFPFKTAADCASAGTIASPDKLSGGDPTSGLYSPSAINADLSGKCANRSNSLDTYLSGLPAWYNAHNPADTEFPIITNSPRVVTNDLSTPQAAYRNVNRASRNLVQAMAAKSREADIYVFTLGMGGQLKTGTGADGETGESLLKCMANTSDSGAGCFHADQPVGLYCYAATESDLSPCFSKLASAILRISK